MRRRDGRGMWYCSACEAQNHEIDGECQYCECGGENCARDNCSGNHVRPGFCEFCAEKPATTIRATVPACADCAGQEVSP